MKRGTDMVYYELDLAGNVRRLRGPNGSDIGGYRYTAFGETLDSPAAFDQPLRWKGRWYQNIGGTEIYDVRARQWAPALGTFLSIDEYAYHDANSTLWGWPGQNPVKFRDPDGHFAAAAPAVVALELAGPIITAAIVYDLAANHGNGIREIVDNLISKPLFSDSKKEDPSDSAPSRDNTGRTHNDLSNPRDIPDKELGESISEVEESLKKRKKEIRDHSEQGDEDEMPGHSERVRRERDWLRRAKDEWRDRGYGECSQVDKRYTPSL